MKFETEFGLGEICVYGKVEHSDTDARMDDLLVKIITITIDEVGQISYLAETSTLQYGLQRFYTLAKNLTGDPDYDQDAGCYPAEGES
jgi:hypothetical protein